MLPKEDAMHLKQSFRFSILVFSLLLSILAFNSFAAETPEDPALTNLIDTYVATYKKEISIPESEVEARKNASLETELKRRDVENYFQENFYKHAYRSSMQDFPRESYQNALNQIQALSKTEPVAMSDLAFAIQAKWQQSFFDIFSQEYERVHGGYRERVRTAVDIANIATMLVFTGIQLRGSIVSGLEKTKGAIFNLFKKAHPEKLLPDVLRDEFGNPLVRRLEQKAGKALADVAEKEAQVSLGTEVAIFTVPLAAAGTIAAATYSPGEVKEIPVPPAQVLTLAEEPQNVQIDDIKDDELLSETVGFIGNGAGFAVAYWALTTGRAFQWLGKLLKAARIPITVGGAVAGEGVGGFAAFVLSVAASMVLDDGVEAAMDWYHEDVHLDAFNEALSAFKMAKTAGNEHDMIRAGLELSRATRRLHAFYQAQIVRGEREPNLSDSALNFMILRHLRETSVDNNGNAIPAALNAHLNIWKKNAEASRSEMDRRQAETWTQSVKEFFGWNSEQRVTESTCTDCTDGQPDKRDSLENKIKDRVLKQLEDERLTKADLIYSRASGFLQEYQRVKEQAQTAGKPVPTLGEFLDRAKRKEQQNLTKLLARNTLAQEPDSLLLQVAGYLRNESGNIPVLKEVSSELEYSVASSSKEPLLYSPLVSPLMMLR